jgi:hypothetical protein
MKPLEPSKLMRLAESGFFTPSEFRIHVIQAAASYSPAELAALLPPAEIKSIRDLAASPPATPDETPRIIVMGMWERDSDPETHQQEERTARLAWYEGIWRWHEFFQGDGAGSGAAR